MKLIVRRRVMVWAHLRVVRNVCGVKPTVPCKVDQVRVRVRGDHAVFRLASSDSSRTSVQVTG